MKSKILFTFIFSILFIGLFSQENKQLEIGDKMPACNTYTCASNNIDVTLGNLYQENGLLVIFSCNDCPFVLEWEKEYPSLINLAKDLKIGIVLVNSNEAKRDDADSPEKMKAHAKEKGYAGVPYLVDTNSEIANSFGANTTPHVFLFNKNKELVYKGAIDDRFENKSKKVENIYLKNAMNELSSGKKISVSTTKNRGCSIKRK